jgi:hypothetical protein
MCGLFTEIIAFSSPFIITLDVVFPVYIPKPNKPHTSPFLMRNLAHSHYLSSIFDENKVYRFITALCFGILRINFKQKRLSIMKLAYFSAVFHRIAYKVSLNRGKYQLKKEDATEEALRLREISGRHVLAI